MRWDEAPTIESWKDAPPVSEPKPIPIGAAGMPAAIAEAAKEFNPVSKFAIGTWGGVNDITMRLKQALGMKLSPEEEQAVRDYRALNDASPASTVGNVATKIAATAKPTAAAMRGAAAVPGLRSVPTVAAAAAGAAGSAVTDPTIDGESAADKALTAGAISGAVDAVTRGASRLIRPSTVSADAQKLIDEGIVPTIGQAKGPNTIIGKLEQRLQSIPVVGDIITSARSRAVDGLNAAALKRSVPPSEAARITAIGRRGMQEADDIIDDGYRTVLGKMQIKPDAQFVKDVDSVVQEAAKDLPDAQVARLQQLVQNRVMDVFSKQTPVPGEVAKARESMLGQLARQFKQSPDVDLRMTGMALDEVKGALRELYKRSASPTEIKTLEELNKAYTNFLRVQRASGYLGAESGVFTASQLQGAVKALDPTMRKSQFAAGNAPMQDLSDPAYALLRNTVANSGSPERLATIKLLEEMVKMNPKAYAGLLGALPTSLAYSRPAQRYLLGDLPGQQLGSGLRTLAPYAGQGAAFLQ